MIRTKEDAKRALGDCADHVQFYFCDGRRINSLAALLKALRKTKKDVYDYHVSESKNDFAHWINDIFGDSKLARDIYKKSKAATIKLIMLRLRALKKRAQ